MSLNIIVEDRIPYIEDVLTPAGHVSYLPAEQITPEVMRSADALITRTRTRCDSALLDGSQCRFIATATIGTDHIDLPYCASRGITVANAPGCNAPAVAQYVMAAILAAHPEGVHGLTVGIIGVGNVGSIVEHWVRSLGMNVLRCDPPRAEAGHPGPWASMEEIAESADVITFHTPLTLTGVHPTHHLASPEFLASLRRKPMIINAARGPVTGTADLLAAHRAGTVGPIVIDCWEGEPDIDPGLLAATFIATPHIAGYSREGKIRATAMAVDAFSRHFGVSVNPLPVDIPPAPPTSVTADAILSTYHILDDDKALRSTPAAFESLRNHYLLRPEPK
ncbi:MAG: 4-phosphoerythronate dehydrogenase [Bacteroides sp.]|nr:4-phosphoerythronate dehydrogenase [Bacteroidales bacterium]MBD5253653.1 4-phosphoerythronate dehydrogenase [Barnesiella sp.]MBD5368927.1 4-phosphoerythronate dehydrogenase [Bacteroides sp.]